MSTSQPQEYLRFRQWSLVDDSEKNHIEVTLSCTRHKLNVRKASSQHPINVDYKFCPSEGQVVEIKFL